MIRYLSPIDFVTGVLSTYDSGDLQSGELQFFAPQKTTPMSRLVFGSIAKSTSQQLGLRYSLWMMEMWQKP